MPTYALDSFANCDCLCTFAIHLIACRVQKHYRVLDIDEFRVIFVAWIAEMLDFSHGEFTDTNQTGTRRNLITECISNLRGSKRQFALIEFQQSFEIDENALSRLRAEETENRMRMNGLLFEMK